MNPYKNKIFLNYIMSKNVLLVDQSLPDYQIFLDSVNESTCAILYSSETTRQELNARIREKTESVERFAFAFMEDGLLCGVPMVNSKELLMSLAQDYHATHMDFLACNTLEDPLYKELYASLEKTVIVGASSDRTGNLKYGGNWTMENTKEDVERVYFTEAIEYYQYLLDFNGGGSNFLYVKNNILYGLGSTNGVLGLGTAATTNGPRPVSFLDSSGNSLVSKIKYISNANSHSMILLNDGTLWGSGINTSGALGLGNYTSVTIFTKVNISNVAKVTCGTSHTMAIKNDGTLWGCGLNSSGQLGLGTKTNVNLFTQTTLSDVANISASNHTMAIKNDGTLWGCGLNSSGQLGLGNIDSYKTIFTQSITNVAKVTCGSGHTMAIKNDGTLWGCGFNQYGGLGLGNNQTPESRFVLCISDVKEVACGNSHTMVIKKDGTLWGSGNNQYGHLGLGTTTNVSRFTKTNLSNVYKAFCNTYNTIVIDNNDTLLGTGYNIGGILNRSGSLDYLNFIEVDTNINNGTSSSIRLTITNNPDPTIRTSTFSIVSSTTGQITYETLTPAIATITGDNTGGTMNVLTGGTAIFLVTQYSSDTQTILSTKYYSLDTNYYFEPPQSLNFSITVPTPLTSRTILLNTTPSSENVIYSSDNLNIATISGNVLTVVGNGIVIIRANLLGTTIYKSFSTTAELNTSSYFESPAFNINNIVATTTSRNIPLSTTPSSGTVTYSSNNVDIATIAGNVLTVVGNGSVTVTATIAQANKDGIKFYSALSVTSSLFSTSSYFESPALNLTQPAATTTSRNILLNATSTNSTGLVTYSSSNTSIATIAGNVLTVVGNGSITVTATIAQANKDGIKFYSSRSVTSSSFSTSSYFESPTLTLSLPINTISRSILLEASTNSTGLVTYSSSNTSIATISGNVLTVVGNGSVTVTATIAQANKDGIKFYSTNTFNALLNTSSLFLNDYYETIVTTPQSPNLFPTDSTYQLLKVGTTDEGKVILTLSNPFVYAGIEYTYVVVEFNGLIYFTDSPSNVIGTSSYGTTSAKYASGIFAFSTDLYSTGSTTFISYKMVPSGIVYILFNTSHYYAQTNSNFVFRVSLFLKNHVNSGDITVEYGTMSSASNIDIMRLIIGIDFGPYASSTGFTNTWVDTNYIKQDINTPSLNNYQLSTAASISNKNVLYKPSKRYIDPWIKTWSIPNNSTTRRILLTTPESNSTAPFTYTTSDSSVATIDGNYLVFQQRSPVRVRATQSANSQYNEVSAFVDIDASYFTQMMDLVVPTIEPWTIPKNSTTRRILLTSPVSDSPAIFSYTTNSSSATIEGNYLVLTNNTPVTVTATQPAIQGTSNYYEAKSTFVLMDSSYFTQIIDFVVVPTIESWTIPNNSPSRVIRLTRPVSDSPAPFTYTTSDPSVATIEEGIYLLAYKAGTVTITASQPAIQGTSNYYEAGSISVTLTPSYFTFMTDICFLAGTPILTDQGTFPIETLTNQTLDGKPILHVTKTLGTEEQMVCFEKDSLGKDQPSQKTVMTMKHRLEKDGKRVKASECVNGESIHTEWYMGEYLYNVLLAEQSLMNVNGLWCETLDPENDVVKFYL